jgi:hypothetical protein
VAARCAPWHAPGSELAGGLRRVTAPAVAWVESPFQLLSAVEAHGAGLVTRTEVVPRRGVAGLAETAAALADGGLPDALTILRPADRPPLRVPRGAAAMYGDPFSGMVQAWLLVSRPGAHVLVDDGLQSAEALAVLLDPSAALTRPMDSLSRPRRALARAFARQLDRLARRGSVTVATALPLDDHVVAAAADRGIRICRTDFRWLRTLPGQPPPEEPTIVLGTSLVDNGFVDRRSYLEWVAEVAADRPVAYLPHRRESGQTLDEVAAIPGVTVRRPGLPVELRLRGAGPDHEIISLPSTAVLSLRTILAPAGTTVTLKPVPEHWWTLLATPAVRRQLLRFGGSEPAP